MKNPLITVLMPVYNGQKYLKQAIESVLNQSFRDFEFLIINDGSTDNSKKIIQSYKDKRIRLINNNKNLGLVACLNKGIKLAKGKYIARMDADDISLPSRFEKQVRYLEKYNKCAVIGAKIRLVNDMGAEIGFWPEDQRTVTRKEIYEQLPKSNCIAHPSVMYRKNIINKYNYYNNPFQLYTEDYDLWLRLCSDGKKIEKLNETLLSYRVHSISASVQTTSEFKVVRAKLMYIRERLRKLKFNSFDLYVFSYCLYDLLLIINRCLKKIYIGF